MKKLFTFATLCITLSSLHAQFTGQFDIGYSTQNDNLKPVFAFTVGYVFKQQNWQPIIEAGFRAHLDQQSANNTYAHVSGGLQYRFLALTAGCAYGGNQQTRDRHVYGDTTVVLQSGAANQHYFSYQVALRLQVTLMKNEDNSPALQLIAQPTYAHKVLYGNVGIRYLLFD